MIQTTGVNASTTARSSTSVAVARQVPGWPSVPNIRQVANATNGSVTDSAATPSRPWATPASAAGANAYARAAHSRNRADRPNGRKATYANTPASGTVSASSQATAHPALPSRTVANVARTAR